MTPIWTVELREVQVNDFFPEVYKEYWMQLTAKMDETSYAVILPVHRRAIEDVGMLRVILTEMHEKIRRIIKNNPM
jgi:hypothetical protein